MRGDRSFGITVDSWVTFEEGGAVTIHGAGGAITFPPREARWLCGILLAGGGFDVEAFATVASKLRPLNSRTLVSEILRRVTDAIERS